MAQQQQAHRITLKGSTAIIVEFFGKSHTNTPSSMYDCARLCHQQVHTPSQHPNPISCCSILFQRGVYAAHDFHFVKKYGLNMMLTTDDALRSYLNRFTKQLDGTSFIYSSLEYKQAWMCMCVYRLDYGGKSE